MFEKYSIAWEMLTIKQNNWKYIFLKREFFLGNPTESSMTIIDETVVLMAGGVCLCLEYNFWASSETSFFFI